VGFVRGGVDRAAGRARYEVHDLRMGRVGVGGLGRRWTRVERPGYRVHVRSRFEDLGSNGAGTHGRFRRSRRLDRFRAALLRRQLSPGHGGRGLRSRTQRLGFVRSEPSGPEPALVVHLDRARRRRVRGVDQLHGIEEGTDRAWSFDAASGAWSELPSAPVRMSAPTAAWSGQELIAAGWSGPLLHPSTDSLQTVAFDPASSAWRTLPDTQLGIVPTGAVAVDGRPIIWQPSADSSFEWRKAAGAWTPIPAPYLGGGGCPVDTAAISGFAFGWACGHPAVFSAATSSWSPVDPPITWDATITPPGVAVAVGDGFVVSAFVPTPDAGATEGSPDTHLWFWRPPRP